MNPLIKTAQDLTRRGDDFISKHGPRVFHEEAANLLATARLQDLFNFEELVHTCLDPAFNHAQNYQSFQFSDLPITLAMGEHCFLDLYFWRRRPTVIHDHHFTGAFQCLRGQNVDLEFEFIKTKKLTAFHDLGELKLKSSRTLTQGHIAPIDLLDKFIHQNHHQADLTINACLRTPEIGETNLSNYLYSGLRFEKEPLLMGRVSRLLTLINMGEFDTQKLNLSLEDALHFLVITYRSQSNSTKFRDLRGRLSGMVSSELGVNIDSLMDLHDAKMNELEDLYN